MSEEALQIVEKRKEAKERQRRKGKLYPLECRVPTNSKARCKSFSESKAKK